MTGNQLTITPDTKISDLLDAYPQLQDKLIEIAPVFSKLKNPVLRKTIAKVTTLKQASVIGKVSLNELIRSLRIEAGQGTEDSSSYDEASSAGKKSRPQWASAENVVAEYDAREDLENGIHPVNKVVKETTSLSGSQVYLLVTGFVPAPLIDMLAGKGFESYTEEEGSVCRTYFRKII